jgi:inositol phosphorylceramide mannosyltransferase catalytic subunit
MLGITLLLIIILTILFLMDSYVNQNNIDKISNNFPKNILYPLDESIQLPQIKKQGTNPSKLLHRTYMDSERAQKYQKCLDKTLETNPYLEHRFYSDKDIEEYIQLHFSERIYNAYKSLNPAYGPAKSDFFRYLILYREGGLYLDIKSCATQDISELFESKGKLIVSKAVNWKHIHPFGVIPSLLNSYDWSLFSGIDYGEYNNWHIVASPGHPVLAKVIQQMVSNIEKGKDSYKYGEYSVLVLTGPIMFTRVIEKYKKDDVIISSSNLGRRVRYKLDNHRTGDHYSKLEDKNVLI